MAEISIKAGAWGQGQGPGQNTRFVRVNGREQGSGQNNCCVGVGVLGREGVMVMVSHSLIDQDAGATVCSKYPGATCLLLMHPLTPHLSPSGLNDVVIAGGMESMSNSPHYLPKVCGLVSCCHHSVTVHAASYAHTPLMPCWHAL